MTMLVRSLKLEVQKVFGSPTLIVLLLSPVISSLIIFWMFEANHGLVTMFLLFNVYIITVVGASLSIVEEKERGTLAAMTVTPLDLRLLMWTKTGVSVLFALVTSAGIAAAAQATGLPLDAASLTGIAGVMLMSALLYAGVAVLIATYSGGVKQVEQVGTGVLLGLLLLLMLPLQRLPDVILAIGLWLPVLNARMLLGVLMVPEAELPAAFLWGAVISNVALGAIFLHLSIVLFKRKVLR